MIWMDARRAADAIKSDGSRATRATAEMLRTGWFSSVYVKSVDTHRLKALSGARDQLVKLKRSLGNQAPRFGEMEWPTAGWQGSGAVPQERAVLPTDRGSVGEQFARNRLAERARMSDSIGDVRRIPINDRRDDEVEARGSILLRFVGALGYVSLTESADCLDERVALLAFVQAGVATAPQFPATRANRA
jgi:hypothetical protein